MTYCAPQHHEQHHQACIQNFSLNNIDVVTVAMIRMVSSYLLHKALDDRACPKEKKPEECACVEAVRLHHVLCVIRHGCWGGRAAVCTHDNAC